MEAKKEKETEQEKSGERGERDPWEGNLRLDPNFPMDWSLRW